MDAAPPLRRSAWQVQLLGGLRLRQGDTVITRLPSRAATALLARLALWPERMHAREELLELLWPGVDIGTGRNRLRQVLSTLKAVLEPPGQARVLLADRLGLRVVPQSLRCDARDFEALLRAGRDAEAAAHYAGELLPGFYDGWIDDERNRLAALAARLATPAGTLPAPPPRPDSIEVGRPELPSYLTRYFGADAQALRLRGLVQQHRLVTVTGPGGGGKTRLALEVAQTLRDTPAFDLVAFVALAACSEAPAMLDAVLAALRVRSGSGDAHDKLAQALAGHRVLLLLDNLEQLLPGAADILARLLAQLPRLHLLATSRRRLAMDGEQECRIEPLAWPPAEASVATAVASPAVALFVDRARASRADFHLGERNTASLVALVRALQGMPLAIELAATRVRAFTPAEMLERLQGRGPGRTPGLDLLQRGGPRAGADSRHASMQRVVEWSWEQLAAPQAALLAACTVFDGGFTTSAAQALGVEVDAALALDDLLAHSLLNSHEMPDGTIRFALYEPVREYAAATLDAASAARLRQRHRAWWQHWADSFGATPPLAAVRAELPNLASAVASALADDTPDDALHLALALRRSLASVSVPPNMLARLEAALARSDDSALKGRVHTLLGSLNFDAGRCETALAHVELGLALAPPSGPVRARALHALASLRWRIERQPLPLEGLLEEALQQAGDDLETQASAHALRAFIANAHDRDYPRGEALHRQALALWEQLGNEHVINGGIYNLAICACNAHRWGEALLRLEAVVHNAREQEDWQQLSSALNVRGNTLMALRDAAGALAAYRSAVELAWSAVQPFALALGLWNAPHALAHLRRPREAALMMGFAVQFWETHFGALTADDAFDLRRLRRLSAMQLGRAAAEAAFIEGRSMQPAQAVALLREP